MILFYILNKLLKTMIDASAQSSFYRPSPNKALIVKRSHTPLTLSKVAVKM
jgi:hypothetical protein